MAKTLPDQIADLFIALIFTGELKPGDKLPPERQLAELLSVDRTSLRMALRTLGRMNAVHSVQGSGIRVCDMNRDMGLDFMDNLYRIPELELGGDFLLSGLELFNRAIPTAIKLALEKRLAAARSGETTIENDNRLLTMIQDMYQALEQGEDLKTLAKMDVAYIDTLMAATGNQVLQASANSSRRIRLLLTEKLFELITVKKHLSFQVGMLMKARKMEENIDVLIAEYLAYIEQLTQPLYEHLRSISANPRLSSSPLKNDRNIRSWQQVLAGPDAPPERVPLVKPIR
ncbi:FadR/GntR family transcriptional regulator [Bacterioplanoides sp. SCSIO 12839]|uniref:FadR/GntR family transcriptional regulator n=1 Tax=Bacterioplanoides sp. SCSIO 12839 TaxID=2829569 RepID=UPI0021067F18|nr:GntR family transcriptional regulator [Bacterioplanoides sp. SCSIO 12839]UTW49211.1 FadR family transcriptional regulator [Bacterioplanoides sp. SCSIO 12839]